MDLNGRKEGIVKLSDGTLVEGSDLVTVSRILESVTLEYLRDLEFYLVTFEYLLTIKDSRFYIYDGRMFAKPDLGERGQMMTAHCSKCFKASVLTPEDRYQFCYGKETYLIPMSNQKIRFRKQHDIEGFYDIDKAVLAAICTSTHCTKDNYTRIHPLMMPVIGAKPNYAFSRIGDGILSICPEMMSKSIYSIRSTRCVVRGYDTMNIETILNMFLEGIHGMPGVSEYYYPRFYLDPVSIWMYNFVWFKKVGYRCSMEADNDFYGSLFYKLSRAYYDDDAWFEDWCLEENFQLDIRATASHHSVRAKTNCESCESGNSANWSEGFVYADYMMANLDPAHIQADLDDEFYKTPVGTWGWFSDDDRTYWKNICVKMKEGYNCGDAVSEKDEESG
jgi:hypothetical protein